MTLTESITAALPAYVTLAYRVTGPLPPLTAGAMSISCSRSASAWVAAAHATTPLAPTWRTNRSARCLSNTSVASPSPPASTGAVVSRRPDARAESASPSWVPPASGTGRGPTHDRPRTPAGRDRPTRAGPRMTRSRKSPPAPDGPLGLLIAILSDTPRLPGALCRDHPDLFDATHASGKAAMTRHLTEARAAAKAVCRACPAIDPCGQWADGLRPSERPGGVVAGKVARPPVTTKTVAEQQYSTTERKPS